MCGKEGGVIGCGKGKQKVARDGRGNKRECSKVGGARREGGSVARWEGQEGVGRGNKMGGAKGRNKNKEEWWIFMSKCTTAW